MSPRIFDRMARDGATWPDGSLLPPMPDALAGAPVVVADSVADYYWASPQNTWSYLDDFGPMTPPFDTMWVQWKMPPMVTIDGERRVMGARDVEAAALFTTVRSDDDQRSVVAVPFLVAAKSRVHHMGATAHFQLDGTGQLLPDCDMRVELCEGFNRITDPSWSKERLMYEVINHFHVPFLAISLMHCKNVALDERPNMANPRSRRKHRIPERTVTVVHVPAALRSASGSRRDAVGEVQPLHLVRGHFKTYTEEAPLFGQHTGTYWWGWQARGTEKAGRRDHIYEVEA